MSMRTSVNSMIHTLPAEQTQHLAHVKQYVEIMVKKIYDAGVYKELIESNEYKYYGSAAFYHDIGKTFVPQEILLKPGRLTDEEMLIMQRHAFYAEEIFNRIYDGSVSGMPVHLANLARASAVYHHEWWNGAGYPYGLSYKQIPLIARITSVCDVYDAITSDRVYRKALSHDFACKEIEAGAGTQFEDVLVKVFLDNASAFKNPGYLSNLESSKLKRF